jgi:hypothetical protein
MNSESSNTPQTADEIAFEQKNKQIYFYQKLFVTSVIKTVELVKSTSEKSDIPQEKVESHKKLRSTCVSILNEYNSNKADVDQVKIIKKVFYTLRDNLTLLKEKNSNIFKIRNEEGKILTIIPGLNINLVLQFLSEDEVKSVWNHIYTMFLTSGKMIYMNTDEKRHKREILDMFEHCEKDLLTNASVFRSFFLDMVTMSQKNSDATLEDLIKDTKLPEESKESGLMSKLLDTESLTDEIKKFSDKDIEETVGSLSQILGSDKDTTEVCNVMVRAVIEDLKSNGTGNLAGLADRVSDKLSSIIRPDLMEKTGKKMMNVMNTSSEELQKMKDENGNLIGPDIMKQMQGVMGGDGNGLAGMAGLMSSLFSK